MQGNTDNAHGSGEMDPQRLRALQRGGLNVKDGQSTGNDGQVGSRMHADSPMVRQEQVDYFIKVCKHITMDQLSVF